MATAGCRKLHNRCCQTLCCRLWINVSLVLRPAPGKPTLPRLCERAPTWYCSLSFPPPPLSNELCCGVALFVFTIRILDCEGSSYSGWSVCVREFSPGETDVCVSRVCVTYRCVPFSNVRVVQLVNWLSVWSCLLLWVRSGTPRRGLLFVLLLLSFWNCS